MIWLEHDDLRDFGPNFFKAQVCFVDCEYCHEFTSSLVVDHEVVPVGAILERRGTFYEEWQECLQENVLLSKNRIRQADAADFSGGRPYKDGLKDFTKGLDCRGQLRSQDLVDVCLLVCEDEVRMRGCLFFRHVCSADSLCANFNFD